MASLPNECPADAMHLGATRNHSDGLGLRPLERTNDTENVPASSCGKRVRDVQGLPTHQNMHDPASCQEMKKLAQEQHEPTCSETSSQDAVQEDGAQQVQMISEGPGCHSPHTLTLQLQDAETVPAGRHTSRLEDAEHISGNRGTPLLNGNMNIDMRIVSSFASEGDCMSVPFLSRANEGTDGSGATQLSPTML